MRILGISGSLRRDSYNTKLLEATAELMPAGAQLEVWERIGLPDAAELRIVP